jgi:hypothetical protein
LGTVEEGSDRFVLWGDEVGGGVARGETDGSERGGASAKTERFQPIAAIEFA